MWEQAWIGSKHIDFLFLVCFLQFFVSVWDCGGKEEVVFLVQVRWSGYWVWFCRYGVGREVRSGRGTVLSWRWWDANCFCSVLIFDCCCSSISLLFVTFVLIFFAIFDLRTHCSDLSLFYYITARITSSPRFLTFAIITISTTPFYAFIYYLHLTSFSIIDILLWTKRIYLSLTQTQHQISTLTKINPA